MSQINDNDLFRKNTAILFKGFILSILAALFCWLNLFGLKAESGSRESGNIFFVFSLPIHWSFLIPLILIVGIIISNYFYIKDERHYYGHRKGGIIPGICLGGTLAIIIQAGWEDFFKFFVTFNDSLMQAILAICVVLALLSALLSNFPSAFWTSLVFFAYFFIVFVGCSTLFVWKTDLWLLQYRVGIFLTAYGFVIFNSFLWLFSLMLQNKKGKKII